MISRLSNRLSCTADFLQHFVDISCQATNVKDIDTEKYVLSNDHAHQALELESIDGLIGKTVSDIYADGGIYKHDLGIAITAWRHQEAIRIKAFEQQAKWTRQPVAFKRIYFTVNGLIRFENCTKLALSDRENKTIIAMLTCAQDLTLKLRLSRLFQLYRDYYPEEQAIQQLLKHLKIDHYFSESPTIAEIWLLLALHQEPRQKSAARLLGLSHKTVHVYTNHLRDKLKVPDLHSVLAQLRTIPVNPSGIRFASERQIDGQLKRGRIVDSHKRNTAKGLLAEGVSFKDVAQQTGVSLSTLYRWFPNKKADADKTSLSCPLFRR